MAVLKDLIVHGPSRFINTANFNSIKANTIGADNGVFNKLIATSADIGSLDVDDLTAQNATVVGLLDIKGQLHTNSWTNANIANIGGSFYISPTVSTEIAANGTPMSVTISGASGNRTIAVSGGAFVTDSVKIYQNNTTSTASWAIGSRVMITGNVRLGTTGTDYPLGTCIGYLNAALTTSGFTIVEVNSPALESIISTIGTSLKSYNIKISMYEIGPKTSEKPVGILLTSYGVDRSTYIDIYGGVNTKNSSGYTEPNVRIGYLGGISSYTDSAGKSHKPTGWGLFTDNGYFKGVIVADSGSIGGTTIDATSFYSLVDGTGYSFSNNGQFSITGTNDSYIKMEQTNNDGEIENTLSVQLSKLYMTLGEVYGQDEIINVIDVINDQITFSQLWEGSSIWLYEKDDNTFDVYEYVNADGQLEYYYDNNQFNPGYYELTNDEKINDSKDYYKPSLLSNNPNDIISLYNYEDLDIKSLVAEINPIQEGSGDPSPSNVRPISGWDEVIISQTPYPQTTKPHAITGKNIFQGNTYHRPTPCHIEIGQTFTASASGQCGIRWYDANMNQLDYWTSLPNTTADGRKYRTYTMNTGCEYFEFYGSGDVTDFMVEIGSTPSPYEPYGQSHSISFPSTVYGGEIDVVKGEGTELGEVDLGSLNWDYSNGIFINYNTDIDLDTKERGGYALCEQYKTVGVMSADNMPDYSIQLAGGISASNFWIKDSRYTNARDFKQAVNGVKVVFEKKTPTPIYCEPTEIKTLKGNNNIWCDTGDINVELNLLYQEVEPISNPAAENFYEFITNPEDWQKYTGDISNLTEKLKDGLQSALSFTTDSLQNEQKLLISSGHETDQLEKASIEVDPNFISLILEASDESTLALNLNCTNDNKSDLNITYNNTPIFTINEANGFVLKTTTGFQLSQLGLFDYKNGLAIGII